MSVSAPNEAPLWLKGQEAVVKALKLSFSDNKMPHAVLFTGPSGTGKSELAIKLASYINCREDHKPCGVCSTCRRILSGIHPDIVLIEPEPEKKSIKIDQVREARKRLQFFAQEDGVRFCMVEDAHFLTDQAAASLLKVLEDPPEHLVFILTTPFPSRLPPTILSRCQVFRLQRLPETIIKEILEDRVGDASPEMMKLAVKLGEGIPGKAIDILEDEEWTERRRVVHQLIRKFAGDEVGDGELIVEAREWATREDMFQLLELLSVYLKDGLFATVGCGEELLADEVVANLWAGRYNAAVALEESLLELNKTRSLFQTNVNVPLALETVFLYIRGRMEKCPKL